MYRNVAAACRLTDGLSTNVFNLTNPLRALKALLAWKYNKKNLLMVKLYPGYPKEYLGDANHSALSC